MKNRDAHSALSLLAAFVRGDIDGVPRPLMDHRVCVGLNKALNTLEGALHELNELTEGASEDSGEKTEEPEDEQDAREDDRQQ